MTPTSPTIQARQLVFETLAELGIADPGPCQESVMVCDGYCVGRRFRFENLQALWREPDEEVDFYDAEGELLRTVSTYREEPLRRAA